MHCSVLLTLHFFIVTLFAEFAHVQPKHCRYERSTFIAPALLSLPDREAWLVSCWDLARKASSGAWVSIFLSSRGSSPTVLKPQYPQLRDRRPHRFVLVVIWNRMIKWKENRRSWSVLLYVYICVFVLEGSVTGHGWRAGKEESAREPRITKQCSQVTFAHLYFSIVAIIAW